MVAPLYPIRFAASRRAAWLISILFLAVGGGAVFLATVVERDEGAVYIGAIVAALSGTWVLALFLRRAPVLVLHEDSLEWRGRRVPYAAVTLGPLRSATYDGNDSHAYEVSFSPTEAPPLAAVTIHSEQWPRWQEIRERIAERLVECRSP